jgi:hypothetical protein
MSGQVTISQLPSAAALTGSELVPIVQNGVTVQTTTGSISGAGALNYPFLTVGSTAGLSQARYIATGSGLSVTDNGAGSTLQINLTGAAQSLDQASNGFIVKTGSTTVTNRSFAVGSGMTLSNADGTAGNPTIGLNATLQNFGSTSGTGILSINGTSVGVFALQGTSNQIAVTNGNASGGTPIVGLASNPTLPGNSFVQLPSGTTSQRGSPAYGAFRYNTDIASLEAYTASGWGAVVSGSGVTTFSGGTTGLTPATPTAGGIVLGGTLSAGSGGTGASSLTGYVYGNGTGVMTASTTVPTTALSGTVTNAQLANSSITINGNVVSLGGSTTVSAVTTNPLTIGTGLSGTSFNGSAPVTIAIANTGVSAGSYGSALAIPQITVNAQGQITSITTNASGATTYQGTWNASTNTPTLASSSGTNGYYYLVSTAGTTNLNGINLWSVGDWAVFNGSVWEKVNGSSSEAFTAITVTGLTGYMYANGTSQVTASTTIPTSALSGNFVSTLSFGTTGLTPSTATSGAITVAGTLAVANGGTGVATLSGLAYGNATSAFTAATAAQVVAVIGSTAVTNATNATNVALTAGSGATNYLHFSASATGNQPVNTNASLTYNYTNNTLTAGINGGTF